MKIAVFTDTYYPETNGVVTTLLNQYRIFGNEGHDVMAFIPRHERHIRIPHVDHYEFQSLPLVVYPNMRLGFPSRGRIEKAFKSEKPDMVHIHTPFLMGCAGIRNARKWGIPVVGTYHTKMDDFAEFLTLSHRMGMVDRRKTETGVSRRMAYLWTNQVYGRCDIVTSPSRTMAGILKENGLKSRTIVLSNGIDLGLFKCKSNFTVRKKIIHFGRMSCEKNVDVLIKAMKHIRNDVVMNIAGDGPDLKRLKKSVRMMGLDQRIRFLGMISHEKLGDVVREHDFS